MSTSALIEPLRFLVEKQGCPENGEHAFHKILHLGSQNRGRLFIILNQKEILNRDRHPVVKKVWEEIIPSLMEVLSPSHKATTPALISFGKRILSIITVHHSIEQSFSVKKLCAEFARMQNIEMQDTVPIRWVMLSHTLQKVIMYEIAPCDNILFFVEAQTPQKKQQMIKHIDATLFSMPFILPIEEAEKELPPLPPLSLASLEHSSNPPISSSKRKPDESFDKQEKGKKRKKVQS